MRVDLKKYLFLGVEKERNLFFKESQKVGIIDFILGSETIVSDESADINHIADAIKILRGIPPTEQEDTNDYPLADGIATKILQLKHHLDKLAEDQRVNRLEMSRVSVYGDFSVSDLKKFEKEAKRKVQFFFSKAGYKDEVELPDELIFINSDHGLDYFISINKEPVQYDKMIEMQITHSIGDLTQSQKTIHKEIHDTEQRLKTYAKYNRFLHHALVYKMNTFNLKHREQYAKKTMDGDLFSVEGWVPVSKLELLNDLMKKMDVHAEEVAIESTDFIPTYLENEGFQRIGEDLVNIYDTPSHTDKDPSWWVLGFFAFFFAMIVGDAGYGLVFILTALFIRYKYGEMKGTGLRVWKLVIILGTVTLAWGLMTNSIFGVQFGIEHPLKKVSLIHWLVEKKAAYVFDQKGPIYKEWIQKFPNLKDAQTSQEFLMGAVKKEHGFPVYEMTAKFADNIMLELALMVGVLHLCVSFARYLDRNLSGIGWIIALIGSYLFIPYFIDATSIIHFVFGLDMKTAAQDGLYMMAGGFSIAVILSIIKHKWLGILEPMAVIQIFADCMSYLRLYALGFAGAVLVATINDFSASMNIVFGSILFILGHLTNMVLGIMAGVIHGLRLNFLEWYHYSFEGGGKKFNPLRKLDYD